MTVGELKEKLNSIPDNMDVMIEKIDQEFNLSLLENAEVKKCTFRDGKVWAKDDCLVLSDEV
jgi:hypothetical protein